MSLGIMSQLTQKNIYTSEQDKFGHVYITLKEFIPTFFTKKQKEIFIYHLIKIIKESLILSKKHGNDTAFVHLYLNNCTPHNFNLQWFKKINKVLAAEFDDTLEVFYIYSDSPWVFRIWKIIKNFIDKDTKNKITFVKC